MGFIFVSKLLPQTLQPICVSAETFFLFSRCQVLIVNLSQDTALYVCACVLLELSESWDLWFAVTSTYWQQGKKAHENQTMKRVCLCVFPCKLHAQLDQDKLRRYQL